MRRHRSWVAITTSMSLLNQKRKSRRDNEDQNTFCSCTTIKASNLTSTSDDCTEYNYDKMPRDRRKGESTSSRTRFGRLRRSVMLISRINHLTPKPAGKHRVSESARNLLEETETITKAAATIIRTETITTRRSDSKSNLVASDPSSAATSDPLSRMVPQLRI
mmetsp:Transcript_26296/g.57600  ORF Transcript_26296/g.57600 Transcript_26296/m.57600 type:complete len:163 (+) Transcript_26296:134-622(+)